MPRPPDFAPRSHLSSRRSFRPFWLALGVLVASCSGELEERGPFEACPAGLTPCGTACVDLSQHASSCGDCDVSCSHGELCRDGTCACGSGFEPCSEGCAEVASDPRNCGGCSVVCDAQQVCSRGACSDECDAELTQCGASCADLATSASHCGACNSPCGAGQTCVNHRCECEGGLLACGTACVNELYDSANCGACGRVCAAGTSCVQGECEETSGSTGGVTGTGGDGSGTGGVTSGTGGGPGSGGGDGSGGTGGTSGMCDSGTTNTSWATSCRTTPVSCTAGTWQAPQGGGETGAPLRHQSEHFAIYYPDGTNITLAQAQAAANTLESIWSSYFGSPIFFPEPYCNSSQKWKAAVHFDNDFPLWGGDWSRNNIAYMGMWIGPAAASDQWGLAHEFMHGVQSTTQAFPGNDCGPQGRCWIFESHANWMPHQIWRDNVHCSEMLVNAPHLYYGSTRDRYCNWQFFEFLKDKHCYSAVNDMWAYQAPAGQRDPWLKLMLSQGWNIEQLNDLFGEWAMHNITWDYENPPPTNGSNHGNVYRSNYGSILDTEGRTTRRLRLTRLESLNSSWASNRRFVSPYYWAPQRWGYNVVRLFPEAGAESVTVKFRGVVQDGADSGWRWGLVATNEALTTARYSSLQGGTDGELSFCLSPGELLFLVVVAAPTQYQKITWDQPSDGKPYPSIYRYPYMVEVNGAWPQGFQNGQLDACPGSTVRHGNGGGCAPSSTPSSVYVGPYARVLGGNVSGSARIEDQATVISGTVSGGRVGALSLIGQAGPGLSGSSFNVSGSAWVQGTFYPLGHFGTGLSASGTARLIGDLEMYTSKSSNIWYGLVDNGWSGVTSISEVTVAPPYGWRD